MGQMHLTGAALALNLAAIPLSPWLLVQGRRVRRDTPVLPPAAGSSAGQIVGSGPSLRLIAVGESTVAGVGVDTHEEALTAQTAAALARRTRQPVAWQAFGWSGATVREATANLKAELAASPATNSLLKMPEEASQESVFTALIVFGVNDSIALRAPRAYARDLRALIAHLRETLGVTQVIVCAAPPMQRFPALPRPLRDYLGLRAAALNRAARGLPEIVFADLSVEAKPEYFARDGFHPSAAGYAAWGEALAGIVTAHDASSSQPAGST